MIRLFSHWIRWRPLAQALLDSSFVIVGVVIALMWNRHGLPIDHKQVILFGLILVAVAMSISALLGFYQRIHKRTIVDTRAQALLSVYLSFPIAYAIYILLPLAPASRELAQLSAMSAVFGILVSRVSASNPATSGLAKRRILVFGTGVKAHEVKRALDRSDPAAEIVGFFAGPNENDSIMPGNQTLSQGRTLTGIGNSHECPGNRHCTVRAPWRIDAAARTAGLQTARHQGSRSGKLFRTNPGTDTPRLALCRMANFWGRLRSGSISGR